MGQDENWSQPETYDVGARLVPGRNVIAVEAGGDGGLDALLCDLTVDLADGSALRVSSDASWVVSSTPAVGWATAEFNDEGWQQVRVIGPADAPPWHLPEAADALSAGNDPSATLQLIGSGDLLQWTAPADGTWRIYNFRRSVGGDVNCLDERLAKAFIEAAHKPYVDYFGDRMGSSILGVFCDTEGNYGNGNGLAWSDSLAPLYQAKTGRDIRLWVPLMLDDDVEGLSARARFDWFDAVSDLYAGFYAEVSDWLAERGMYYIANVWEESLMWQASCVSDHMKVQRFHDARHRLPGTEGLRCPRFQGDAVRIGV